LQRGGNLACILNASNEIAVDAFINGRISFPDIWLVNEQVMEKSTFITNPVLEDYIATDLEARRYARETVGMLQLKH
jgi:1-deoxy-D-xylulose-5-phosphate reductoisomerase